MTDEIEKRLKLIYRHVTSTEIILFLVLIWVCAGSPRMGMLEDEDISARLTVIEAKLDALQVETIDTE